MREVLSGAARSFAQVARLVPPGRGGKATCPATIWRWFKGGVRVADGRRVRLEALKIGGRYVTSEGALLRFLAAQQGDAPAGGQAPPTSRSAQDAEETARLLDAIGI
jgi:hypothetical protein